MAKGKGSKSSGGPHKSHGPKKTMFHWAGPMKWSYGNTKYTLHQKINEDSGLVEKETTTNTHDGILSKYYDYEAWQQACTARGKKSVSKDEFRNFFVLSLEDKKTYFENISNKGRNTIVRN